MMLPVGKASIIQRSRGCVLNFGNAERDPMPCIGSKAGGGGGKASAEKWGANSSGVMA